MSKLFNTLEQIRRNESYQVSGSRADSSSKNDAELKRRKALFFLILAVACIAAIYFMAPLILKTDMVADDQINTGNTVTATAQRKAGAAVPVLLPAGKPSELNDLATEFIKKDDHWRGIYLLDSITRSSPQMIEPFINLSVALAELGLFEPAKRYLKEAIRRQHLGSGGGDQALITSDLDPPTDRMQAR